MFVVRAWIYLLLVTGSIGSFFSACFQFLHVLVKPILPIADLFHRTKTLVFGMPRRELSECRPEWNEMNVSINGACSFTWWKHWNLSKDRDSLVSSVSISLLSLYVLRQLALRMKEERLKRDFDDGDLLTMCVAIVFLLAFFGREQIVTRIGTNLAQLLFPGSKCTDLENDIRSPNMHLDRRYLFLGEHLVKLFDACFVGDQFSLFRRFHFGFKSSFFRTVRTFILRGICDRLKDFHLGRFSLVAIRWINTNWSIGSKWTIISDRVETSILLQFFCVWFAIGDGWIQLLFRCLSLTGSVRFSFGDERANHLIDFDSTWKQHDSVENEEREINAPFNSSGLSQRDDREVGLKKNAWLSLVHTMHLKQGHRCTSRSNRQLIYHGVPGMGLLEIGLALPFTFSSPPIRSDVSETSP